MKLEAVDKKNTSLTCVATVADVMGERILIHFDGWEDSYDYWCEPSSAYIHPVGWCQENGKPLSPPNGMLFLVQCYIIVQQICYISHGLLWTDICDVAISIISNLPRLGYPIHNQHAVLVWDWKGSMPKKLTNRGPKLDTET